MSWSELGEPKYLLLTTSKKDGTTVSTPVWCVREGDSLLVVTQSDSGKVKRVRNNSDVLVGPCDMRGRPRGPQVPAHVVLLNAEGTSHAADLIKHRYGLMGRLFMARGRNEDRAGLAISSR